MSTQPTDTDAAVAAANALAAYVHAVETGQDIGSHYEAAVAAALTWKNGRDATAPHAVVLPKPGDLVEHIHRDLDPRRVVAVGVGWLTLEILGSESSRLPIENYRVMSR
ncbi:hypothetical protein [Oerskovia jenensis]|uniref:hypothetical protein n=1 Tax=Oerskovia jenensis TaxID=162169 RepID=UPI0036DBB8B1